MKKWVSKGMSSKLSDWWIDWFLDRMNRFFFSFSKFPNFDNFYKLLPRTQKMIDWSILLSDWLIDWLDDGDAGTPDTMESTATTPSNSNKVFISVFFFIFCLLPKLFLGRFKCSELVIARDINVQILWYQWLETSS